ncbi:MAG: metallophosphoesterase [Deltaproteobacteria bacterium]|nr:metallophosphoesterase [Deltaproteobacteria bacterium]
MLDPVTGFSAYVALSVLGAVVVVLAARLARGRLYGRFAAVLLTIHTTSSVLLLSALGPSFTLPFAILQLIVFANFFALIWARMRSPSFRFLVSWPAAYFLATTFFGLPFGALSALGLELPLLWVPFVIGAFGLFESLRPPREEDVDVFLTDGAPSTAPEPVNSQKGHSGTARPLRLVQISDPHLGPFMSVARLRKICERAVERDPDLVVLTGDFLTMESQRDSRHLVAALEPLRRLPGRVFACRGNHDLETPELVSEALSRVGVRLLIDDEATIETPAGRVQILGVDFVWRRRAEHLHSLSQRYPRRPHHLRVVLLHDPSAFVHIPNGDGDLVLSGHTHGGQLGLLTLGLTWTVLRPISYPDHGLWKRGSDHLYVHRGTGHYGFPLRIGVPAERSMLRVHDLRPTRSKDGGSTMRA